MKKIGKERLFEVMGRLDKTFKPKLNETGEWVNDEDDIAWKEALKSEVQKIESETNGKVKLLDVRGFDKYQGPYAITEINGRRYKIWTSSGFSFDGDNNNLLWIENYPIDNTSSEDMNAGFMGTSEAIVDMLNNDTKQNEADGIQFDIDSMPQPMNERIPPFNSLDPNLERDTPEWKKAVAQHDMRYAAYEKQEWKKAIETYNNGDEFNFAYWLKGLDIKELMRFLKWVQKNNIKF